MTLCAEVLQFDGFGREVVARVNRYLERTPHAIPLLDPNKVRKSRERNVFGMNIIKRAAIVTVMHSDPDLSERRPITPRESEDLVEGKRRTAKYTEDLGILLYQPQTANVANPSEYRALLNSIKDHRKDLGLTPSDLDENLLVVNPGLVVDYTMPHAVKFTVIPGVTEVYTQDVLTKRGKVMFEYGWNHGLPLGVLGGSRELLLPVDDDQSGLMVLRRYDTSALLAKSDNISSSTTAIFLTLTEN